MRIRILRFLAASLLSGVAVAAIAQTPAGAGNAAGQTGVPATIEQDKGGDAARQPVQRSSTARPGTAPPPLDIRIRETGISMPKCAAESREGEACKK